MDPVELVRDPVQMRIRAMATSIDFRCYVVVFVPATATIAELMKIQYWPKCNGLLTAMEDESGVYWTVSVKPDCLRSMITQVLDAGGGFLTREPD